MLFDCACLERLRSDHAKGTIASWVRRSKARNIASLPNHAVPDLLGQSVQSLKHGWAFHVFVPTKDARGTHEAGFSSNCLPQFGYFNNAVASPCAYRSIPSVKELRMSALDQLRPSDVHFTPES